ncbi:MAG: ABC transporter ATP-binding protein [Deltaproteobacteria bacterium]|nr:ABC transporter ATP-binding protein [Deltaproteobacteria bacterium]MCW5808435.1 ABC transporter ATP-binding protein [Deltaproteobacteria bacterium]
MIRARNLSKFYGAKRALDRVSFEIDDGETVGFLGLNGAGKTTALRILACDLRPTGGTVEVGGIDAVTEPHEVRKRIGFLPENPPIYADMIVADYLRFAGQLRQMTRAEIAKRLPDVLGITNLDDVATEVIGTLSHGYRQRVGVAQAIIHQPKFLILDEPTRGLDPVQIVDMRNLIHDLKQNHTVLISSHILSEISQTCDRLLVLGRGTLLGVGTENELAGHVSEIRQITVTIRAPSGGDPYRATKSDDSGEAGGAEGKKSDKDADVGAEIKKVLAEVDGVKEVGDPYEQGGGLQFWLETTKDCRAEVSRAVVGAKLDLLKLDYARSEIENTFIRLVGGSSDASN